MSIKSFPVYLVYFIFHEESELKISRIRNQSNPQNTIEVWWFWSKFGCVLLCFEDSIGFESLKFLIVLLFGR